MRKTVWAILLLSLFSCETGPREGGTGILPEFKDIQVQYPDTYRDTTVVDDYFGMKVADPYRWLEEEDSPSTRRWVGPQSLYFIDKEIQGINNSAAKAEAE